MYESLWPCEKKMPQDLVELISKSGTPEKSHKRNGHLFLILGKYSSHMKMTQLLQEFKAN